MDEVCPLADVDSRVPREGDSLDSHQAELFEIEAYHAYPVGDSSGAQFCPKTIQHRIVAVLLGVKIRFHRHLSSVPKELRLSEPLYLIPLFNFSLSSL